MRSLVARKVAHLLVVLWLVSLATFFMLQLVPGDPAAAVLGTSGTPEQYARVRSEMGIDDPVVGRYVDWLGGALRGDLGRSLTPPYDQVSDAIRSRLPVTLEIAVLGLSMALVASIPVAMWSAHRVGERFDRVSSAGTFALLSLPSFLAGLLLIQLFVFHPELTQAFVGCLGAVGVVALARWAITRVRDGETTAPRAAMPVAAAALGTLLLVVLFPTFPRQGFVRLTSDEGIAANLRHVFLPALTVALAELAVFTRVLRSEMISVLESDFILAARAKGLPTWRILWSEALRPSSFSLVTVAGVSLGRLIGGTMIVEVLFNLPGMGRLLVDSIGANDFTTVQGAVLVLACLYVVVNAGVDVLYTFLDPRVRDADA
jgi:peptide/nickel transport system permease protein